MCCCSYSFRFGIFLWDITPRTCFTTIDLENGFFPFSITKSQQCAFTWKWCIPYHPSHSSFPLVITLFVEPGEQEIENMYVRQWEINLCIFRACYLMKFQGLQWCQVSPGTRTSSAVSPAPQAAMPLRSYDLAHPLEGHVAAGMLPGDCQVTEQSLAFGGRPCFLLGPDRNKCDVENSKWLDNLNHPSQLAITWSLNQKTEHTQ